MTYRLSVLVVVLGLAGCGTTEGGSLWAYSGTRSNTVTTNCGGGYVVAMRVGDTMADPNKIRVLVTPYPGSLVYNTACKAIRGKPVQSVTGVPFEEGAQEFIAGLMKRPDCRVASGQMLTPMHSEFGFWCPAPEKKKTI